MTIQTDTIAPSKQKGREMPNSVAHLLGILLTFYILSFMGTLGVILGLLVIGYYVMMFIVFKQLDSHDKRLNEIIILSLKNNKKTTGEEFNIKPIKYDDEVKTVRYIEENYERKDNEFTMKHYIEDKDYAGFYNVKIQNLNGIALIEAEYLD
ncbi:MAG: hypothetical protein JXQ76_04140 [Campylobacterales bacterium]|nr:hypothetical protein [Campylobacterales bacterium]